VKPTSTLWTDLKDAVRGTHQDYTEGAVSRAILLLAVPMVLETAMESLFAVVDIFFVSKLGPAAVATVALTESILTVVFTLALGLSIGVTATVARRIGEKDPEGAARTAVQAIALGIGVAAVIGVLGATFAPELLRAMGASRESIETGVGYTRIMLGGNATLLLLFLINAAFRGAGDAVIAMRVLWLGNGINILLDPMLIFGVGPFPELGVQGAAVATNIGRGTAVLLQLWLLGRVSGRLQVARRHLRILPSLMGRLIRLSGTGTFQVFIGMASWVGLIRILASFQDQVLTGYAIGIRLIIFALLPSWGMSNAAATLVGQNLGAGKPERAERSVWIAGFYNMIFLGVIGLLFIVFAHPIVSFFTTLPEPLRWGVLCLRIVSCGFLFYAYGMVLTQSFNGAGDAWTPTWINLFCFWLFELPFAYIAAHELGWGPTGVFVAMTVSFSALAVVSGVIFRRGRWKLKQV
jgi:putative MATE family efflux protein